MALSGDFKETSFADLLQLYAISRQTVALRVHGEGTAQDPDGVFYFADGDLVGASLHGLEGREAIRAALGIKAGAFTVDVGATLPAGAPREQLRGVVMEEVVKMDEEQRAGPPGQVPPKRPPPRRPAPTTAARPKERRVLPLVAVGAAVLLVAAAGAWLAMGRSPGGAPGASASPAPAAATPAAPAVRGVKADEILLGMVASFSGSNKERGRAMKAGWEAALAAANDAGGVHGRRLRLVTLDDGYDPARTAPAMKQLLEVERAFAVVGNVGTATSKVAVPYATQQKAVFFGALSGADLLRKTPPDRYVFNYRASLAEEAGAAVRWLVDVKRVAPDKIAVLVQKDDFGESGWRGALRQLEASGAAAGGVLRLEYERNTADVREALDTLRGKGAGVQAVVLVATYKPAATFVRKAKDAGQDLLFVTVSADSNGLAQELVESGARYADKVVVTQVVPVPTSRASGVLKYRQALEKYAPGEPAGSTTLEAWIGAQVFLEGLRRAGPALDAERLVSALEGIQGLDLGTGGALGFSAQDHQASRKVWGWALQPDATYRQIDLE
jgi:ABC-type branched-subunit amino acid transport system substrate-binding protein